MQDSRYNPLNFRVQSLAHLGTAMIHLHRTILVKIHECPCLVQVLGRE